MHQAPLFEKRKENVSNYYLSTVDNNNKIIITLGAFPPFLLSDTREIMYR